MQVSINTEEANVRPRHTDHHRDMIESGSVDVKRQSLRLIDLHQDLPAHVDYPNNPSVRFFDDPFSSHSPEGLPQPLLDRDLQPRDPFDLSYLQPPPQQFVCAKGANNGASQSTPSLPIAVAGRPSIVARSRPSELSASSGFTSISSTSMRLSSSADSALAALPPPPPPPGQNDLANSDEVDACGCHDHPDLPPRAALQNAARPRIMPIVENGQRTSYTHYWVIPPRVQPSRHSESPSALPVPDGEHYVNVKGSPATVFRSASMPPRTQPRERRYVKRPSCEPDSDLLGCATNRAFVDDMEFAACGAVADFDVAGLDGGAQVVSSVESDSSWEAQQQHQRSLPAAEDRRVRILAVRDAVHGVTDEEAQMILQTHRWEVARSIRLLKVEQLFRLGVTPSKSECKRILDDAGGDLALASGRLIGQQTAQQTLK